MELLAKKRTAFGKKNRALRRAGLIPGELYGHGVVNEHVVVPEKEFARVFKEAGMNTMVNLALEEKRHPVVIHDVQHDYLTNAITHVDFYEVSLREAIRARVPLEFIGEAPAVKEKGGILNKSMSEIEVEALPEALPHRLPVDLTALDDLNKSFYVRDLMVASGVKLMVEPETVIVTVTPPRAEEEAAPAPTPDISVVKVEDEEKKVKRQVEKEKEEGN